MKTFSFITALVAGLLCFGAGNGTDAAQPEPIQLGKLVISEVWARPTPPNAKTGAVFFVIRNTGSDADVLINAAAGISEKVEIHQTRIEGGIMTMRHVGRIDIPAGGMAMLKPGGFHIMFTGLHAPIRAGDHFPLTLTFEKSGTVEIEVSAGNLPKGEAIPNMDHGKMPGH